MDSHEEEVKKLQAEAMAKLQKDMARINAERAKDPLRIERRSLGSELARTRRIKKFTQAQLAVKTGIPQSNISLIENGKANPALSTLLAITKALGANLVVEY